jgi:phosphatidylserine/phosphatidylglycerophosphate/cardiolipin synthase-like enzyme
VGSLNLHPRSLFYDTEMAINVIDRDEAAKLTAVFEKDITDEFAKQVKAPKDLEVNSEWFNRFLEQYFFDHF